MLCSSIRSTSRIPGNSRATKISQGYAQAIEPVMQYLTFKQIDSALHFGRTMQRKKKTLKLHNYRKKPQKYKLLGKEGGLLMIVGRGWLSSDSLAFSGLRHFRHTRINITTEPAFA